MLKLHRNQLFHRILCPVGMFKRDGPTLRLDHVIVESGAVRFADGVIELFPEDVFERVVGYPWESTALLPREV